MQSSKVRYTCPDCKTIYNVPQEMAELPRCSRCKRERDRIDNHERKIVDEQIVPVTPKRGGEMKDRILIGCAGIAMCLSLLSIGMTWSEAGKVRQVQKSIVDLARVIETQNNSTTLDELIKIVEKVNSMSIDKTIQLQKTNERQVGILTLIESMNKKIDALENQRTQ